MKNSLQYVNDGWFGDLHNKRLSFVESSRENDFEHGIWQSTVDKYAEPDHFIYELLQNAEDQEATEVAFELQERCLIFCHNGDPSGEGNLFSRDDVRNITGIGNSSKPEQANKIGRFGIGFKSVFVVTDRPEIYSRLENAPFAFAIENLVVPVALNAQTPDPKQNLTKFILPFRQNQAAKMYEIIAAKLRSLGADSLLFLEHLTQITWKTGDEYGTYLCERDWVPGSAWEVGRCSLVGEAVLSNSENYDEKTYLLFNKPTSIEGADRTLTARIAFNLKNGVITPETDMPSVNVYFPTEERVGLRFRLHAPFLLTDNRANIKPQEPLNRELVKVCAELLSESLPQLRDLGLLSVSCLNCFPLQEDQLIGSVFLPLYKTVLNTFKTERLIPVLGGEFAGAEQVKIAETSALRSLLDGKQLSQLFDANNVLWLSAEITEAEETFALRRYLQQGVELGVVTPPSFADKVDSKFFEKQSDSWLIAFYGFLTGLEALWRARKSYYQQEGALRGKPFIRLYDESHTNPFRPDGTTPNAYLPPKGETKFPIVKRSVAQDEKALRFLESLGLTQPDMADEVLTMILPLYQNEQPDVTPDLYSKHLEQISRALASPSDEKRKRLQDGLKESYFIRVINAADPNQLGWKRPVRKEVFCISSSVGIWFEANADIWFAAEITLQNPFWGDISSQLNLLSYVPTWRQSPYRVATPRSHKRGLDAFDPNANITGLEYAVLHINAARAKILWDLLLTSVALIKGVVEIATRQDFSNAKKEHLWSKMGETCRDNKWMPDAFGSFHKPQELFLTDLPREFEKDTARAKILAATLGMKKPELQQLAEKLGVSIRSIEIIQQNPESFKRWLEGQNAPETEAKQPIAPVPSSTNSNQDVSNVNKSSAGSVSAPQTDKGNISERQRTRLLSYVLPSSENTAPDKDGAEATSDNKEAVNRAGVDIVLAWEVQAGRYPTEMSHTHPGYDVESKNEAGEVVRYIEVKSRTGVWDQQGVTLSDTQFHEAQKRGYVYWLYIVENADQENAQLFRIQDPANHVEYFCFDKGWSGLSE